MFKVTRKEGLAWNSNRIQADEYEVVSEFNRLRVFRETGNQKSPMAENPSEITRMVLFTEKSEIPYVKFPLRVGAKWKGNTGFG